MKRLAGVILFLVVVSCPGLLDTDPPLVVIVDPSDNSTVPRGTVEISATATDESDVIRVVNFLVDGMLVGSDSTAPPPYSVLWNTQNLTVGSQHRIRVEAEDGYGNVGSDSVLVTVGSSTLKFNKKRR